MAVFSYTSLLLDWIPPIRG